MHEDVIPLIGRRFIVPGSPDQQEYLIEKFTNTGEVVLSGLGPDGNPASANHNATEVLRRFAAANWALVGVRTKAMIANQINKLEYGT